MLLVKVLIKFHKVLKESEMFYFEDVYYDSSYHVLQSSLVPNKEKYVTISFYFITSKLSSFDHYYFFNFFFLFG